jgi:hypothetical protein
LEGFELVEEGFVVVGVLEVDGVVDGVMHLFIVPSHVGHLPFVYAFLSFGLLLVSHLAHEG